MDFSAWQPNQKVREGERGKNPKDQISSKLLLFHFKAKQETWRGKREQCGLNESV